MEEKPQQPSYRAGALRGLNILIASMGEGEEEGGGEAAHDLQFPTRELQFRVQFSFESGEGREEVGYWGEHWDIEYIWDSINDLPDNSLSRKTF